MKITSIETIPLAIPYDHGGREAGFRDQDWSRLNVALVRVETDNGLVGWGEAFSYNCLKSVKAALDGMVTPIALGQDARDISGLTLRVQKALHLFGRYGITLFAISGLDIALWDIAAKAAGLPLHRLLGGAGRERIPAYSSLFRYGDPEVVAERCQASLDEGYRWIKLHEIREPEVRIARETAGDGIPIMVDTNCPWTPREALENALRFKPYDIYWLEEPIWPPEDFGSLARLQSQCGIALAAGENAGTAFEFVKMFEAGAVSFAQPSVTKVGGVTELLKIATLARVHGVTLMPHSPYFGPGFLASLQVAAAQAEETMIERIYLEPHARLHGDLIDPQDGYFRVPDGPGLGADPDPDVIKEFTVDA